ncbi:MAG: tetratricopeptide repeat protein [bacterium]
MRRSNRLKDELHILIFPIILLCVLPTSISAQSPQQQAAKWYEKAVNETEPQNKINSYLKAIELDRKYVDAYYQIGLEYMKLQDYRNAERFLKKAYTSKLALLDSRLKSEILFNLAVASKHLNKLKASEDALRGARNLTADDTFRKQISLQLGEILYQQNRFDEALSALNQGFDPENPEHRFYKNLIESIEKSTELAALYEKADQLALNGQFDLAYALFVEINNQLPGFQDVETRISEIKRRKSTTPKKPSRSSAQSRPLAKPAISQRQTPVQEPEAHSVEPEQKRQKRKKQSAPPSKKSSSFQQSQPQKTTNPISLSKNKRTKSNPVHPKVNIKPKRSSSMIERSVYTDYTEPRSQRLMTRKSSHRTLYLSCLVIIVFLAALSGMLFAFPISRAKMYLLLRKQNKAAEVYQRLLIKNPGKLWLYPVLAQIYDREGRTDEHAIKVYKMIQHLSLNGQDNLKAAIAYKYLREHNVQAVTIEFVEKTPNSQTSSSTRSFH